MSGAKARRQTTRVTELGVDHSILVNAAAWGTDAEPRIFQPIQLTEQLDQDGDSFDYHVDLHGPRITGKGNRHARNTDYLRWSGTSLADITRAPRPGRAWEPEQFPPALVDLLLGPAGMAGPLGGEPR